jgi:hypothetical protein
LADLTSKDISGIAEAVAKILRGPNKAKVSRGGSASDDIVPDAVALKKSMKGLGAAQDALMQATRKLTASSAQALKDTEEGRAIQQQYNDALADVTKASTDASRYARQFAGTNDFSEQKQLFKLMQTNTQGLSSTLAQAQKNASAFGAGLIESHSLIQENTVEYAKYIKGMSNSASALGPAILRNADMWDESSNTIKDSLDAGDFAKLRVTLGNAQTSITETMHRLEVESLDKLLGDSNAFNARLNAPSSEGNKSGEELRDAMLTLAVSLEKQGAAKFAGGLLDDKGMLDADKAASMVAADFHALGQELQQFSVRTSKVVSDLDTRALMASNIGLNGVIGKQINAAKAYASELFSGATAVSNLSSAARQFAELVKQGLKFNTMQVPETFLNVQKSSLMMGMSFDETAEFMQRNKGLMSAYGDSFGSNISKFSATLGKAGFTTKQTAEELEGLRNSAAAQGVNTRDADSFNNFIKDTRDNFSRMSGVLNISLKEFNSLNEQLARNHNVLATTTGMSEVQGRAYSDNIKSQLLELAVRTHSTELAKQIIDTQEEQKRSSVSNRITEAAKTQVQMQQLGFSSEDSQEAYNLILKGQARTKEEDDRLQLLMKQTTVQSQKAVQYQIDSGSLSGMLAQQSINEVTNPGGSVGKMQELGLEEARAERNGNTAAEAAAAAKKSTGSETGAMIGNILNVFDNATGSLFVGGLKSASLGLIGLTAASLSAGAMLGKGGIFSKIGGALFGGSAAASALSSGEAMVAGAGAGAETGILSKLGGGLLGKLAKGGLVAAVGGLTGGALTAAGAPRAGGVVSALGDAAGGAVSGAMMGSALGLPGAVLGGLAGAAYGLYSNRDSIFGQSAPQADNGVTQPGGTETQNAVNNTTTNALQAAQQNPTSPAGIIAVSDSDSLQQLIQISASMSTMVTLLQGMSNGQSPLTAPSIKSATSLLTSKDYMQGTTK